MTIEERLSLLEQQIAAQVPTPTEYYTSRWSGEEIDNRIASLSNQNLLDNAYFKGGGSQQGGGQFPINQRGQTSYGAGYGMDRWFSHSCTVSIQSDGILISGGANYGNLSQIIDNPSRFAGMTVTLSALILGGSGISNGAYLNLQINGTDHVTNMSQGLVSVTVTCPSQITNMQAAFVTSPFSGYSLQVIAAKLELGSHQTLAYQDEDGNWQLFETPDYGEELVKCRYYFRRYGVSSLGQIYLPPALGVSGTEANFSIVSEPMRIAPTISGNGFLLAGTTGDGFIADGSASFSLLGASPLSGIITVKVTCSNRTLIPGNYYTLYANPEYGAFLDLSAEL